MRLCDKNLTFQVTVETPSTEVVQTIQALGVLHKLLTDGALEEAVVHRPDGVRGDWLTPTT